MKAIIQLAVIGVVIYLAITQLVPWITSQGEGLTRSGIANEISDSECVNLARRSSETLTNEVRKYRPPIDENAWTDSMTTIDDRLFAAESSCTCPRTSCGTATLALSSIRGLASEYDNAFRGGGVPPLNAARTLDEIHGYLNEAGNQARSGD